MSDSTTTSRKRSFQALALGLLALAAGAGPARAGTPVKLIPQSKPKVTLQKKFKNGNTGAAAQTDAQATEDNAAPNVQATPSPTPARLEKILKQTPQPQTSSTPAPTPEPDDQSAGSTRPAPAAPAATAEADKKAEADRLARQKQEEESRLAEERRQAEEKRLAQQKREEEQKAEDARLAQQKRDEELVAQKREAERKAKAEEARLAQQREDERKAEEARQAEQKRQSELAQKREDERKAEQARLAQQKREEELAQKREEERKAEERRLAKKREDDQKAEERRLAEAKKKADAEARKAEEAQAKVMTAALDAQPSPETRANLEKLLAESKDPARMHTVALRLGEVDLALGAAGAAQTAFQSALAAAQNPDDSRKAGEKLAEAAAANGDFKTASRQWATLRLEGGANPDPRVLNAEAMALAVQNDYENSGKLWAQFQTVAAAAKPAPELVAQALLGQALAAELQGRRDEAQQLLRRIEHEFASTPQAALAQKRLEDLKDPIIP